MDKETASALATANLEGFKQRMQIYGESRNSDITRMLATSFIAIESLVGTYNPENDLLFVDLVYQRTRYDYNDQLEYFGTNFQPDILDLSLDMAEVVDDDTSRLP